MTTQKQFIKVHAAEYLLWSGYPDGVRETFLKEEERSGTEPAYRIGIWRVLAQAATDSGERRNWYHKIVDAFADTDGKDRTHAAETIAKLKIHAVCQYPSLIHDAIAGKDKMLSLYSLWASALCDAGLTNSTRDSLLDLLASDGNDTVRKAVAAYMLRRMAGLSNIQWKKLTKMALSEPVSSPAAAYMLSAAIVAASPEEERTASYRHLQQELWKKKNSPRISDRTEWAGTLAEKGTRKDLPVLAAVLNEKSNAPVSPGEEDARASAAYAILMITRRN